MSFRASLNRHPPSANNSVSDPESGVRPWLVDALISGQSLTVKEVTSAH